MATPQLSVENGAITLRLTPETTARVTKLLEEALVTLPLGDDDLAHCQTLAALFRAVTIAAVHQCESNAADLSLARQALTRLGLAGPEVHK